MTTEKITWHSVADCLPEAGEVVLVYVPHCDCSVQLGFYEPRHGWARSGVTHWADMPKGPRQVVDLTQHIVGVPV